MIKKLKLRFFITNMAILSCTLLVGLTVLFGLLYHSEVESSYSLMQEMLDDASAPEHQQMPPDKSRMRDENAPPPYSSEPEGETPEFTSLPTAMTDTGSFLPMIYTYSTMAVIEPTDEDDAVFCDETDVTDSVSNLIACFDDEMYWHHDRYGFNSPPDFTPPYWGFMDPNNPWQYSHDKRDNDSDALSDNSDDDQDERSGSRDDNPPPEQPALTTVTTVTTVAATTAKTDGGSRPADPPRADQPPPPPEASMQPVATTVSSFSLTTTESSVSASATITKQTTTAATTTSTGSAAAAAETTSANALVQTDEGAYIPDALVANIGDDGSIQSYSGNNSESDDEERIRAVNDAMNEVKERGAGSGTITIDDTPYRFLYQTDTNGNSHLVLLNRTLEISTLSRLLVLFFFITLLGLIGMFFLSMLLANWTVTPIAIAWEKQKQFVADASHELKTPLAVISANTEVVRANPQESVAGSSKWLNYIQSETMRMSKLVSNLLSVARMDQNSSSKLTVETVSLSDLVSNTCMVFDPIVFEHGKTLNSVIQKNVYIHAEEDNVKQLLSIFLDNAVLHSVPKAQITVSLSKDAQGKIRLAVSNTAKDIPKDQLDHLFDRFYRVDKEGSPNGSGLGLSIARSIIHQMGGTLTVTSENQLVTFLAVLS